MSLRLGSPSFHDGAGIPKQFTCDGADNSPALFWQSPPSGTQSLALIVNDSDSLFGSFVHWVLFNIPAESKELAQGTGNQQELADGSRQGLNGEDAIGYMGPCPPGTSPHHYVFTLYALDTKLALDRGAKKKQLEKATEGHILAEGRLIGSYHR